MLFCTRDWGMDMYLLDGQVIDLGRTSFTPGYTNPNARFQVPATEFKAFCALPTATSTAHVSLMLGRELAARVFTPPAASDI